ncbi:MAG: SGNH/GDSL hydrolase family protein, partial [Victivallales bacterium]|nr:SGNH/GDSL hydrolase family protein [Victivallales bacterium]
PVYRKGGGWNDGVALRGVAGIGCALKKALDPYSVRLRLPDGTEMRRGKDFDYTDDWGTLGRIEGGRISATQEVLISYRYIPNRLDSVIRSADGKLRLECGVPRSYCPKTPALKPGDTRLLNVFTEAQTDKLTDENIFIITETTFPAEDATAQQAFIPNVMKKLRNGEHVRILAWGDSVTECAYLPPDDRWQIQFLNRIKAAFPKADIELVSNGWGGRTIPAFLKEPEGSKYNYQKTVLDVKADLVVTEFVNDAGLKPEIWDQSFNRVLKDFRAQGTEWIILTPHYVRPDWMGLTSQNGPEIEDDPRPYVAFIRKFTAEKNVALADAAKRYGRLWRQGIPYNTLMTNTINHPDRDGLKIFADALMSIFGE